MRKTTYLAIIIIIVFALAITGIFNWFDPLFDKFYPEEIDTDCETSSDCKLIILSEEYICGRSRCKSHDINNNDVIAVNKNWEKRCFFPFINIFEHFCNSSIEINGIQVNSTNYEPTCQEGKCVK